MPTAVDFKFYVGEDYSQPFTIYKADGVTVEDITGWTIKLSVRRYADPSFPVLLSPTAVIDSGPAGTCHVNFARADTSGWECRTYAYDLSRTDVGGDSALGVGYLFLLPRSR